jgi:hypothetical protein
LDSDPIGRLSAQRYGEQLERSRATGNLRVRPSGLLTTAATGTIVRDHTFYGQ